MLDGLVKAGSISFLFVFLEGVLSFFSPCVIPLIPVYMSYLSGNTSEDETNGTYKYDRKKVFLHTLMFVIGISFSFIILGMSFTVIGNFFNYNKMLFTRIGGIFIIVLGLFQLGIFELKFLQNTKKLQVNFNNRRMNPLVALIMGFTFSFAWTPCVGPALSSVLILASSAKNAFTGYGLVIVYTLGFVLPFLILGLFTTRALEFLNRKKKLLKYTVKIGGIILIIMGIMTFTGWMNGISKYLSVYTIEKQNNNNGNSGSDNEEPINNGTSDNEEAEGGDENTSGEDTSEEDTSSNSERKVTPSIDFTLEDQYGNTHTLSDYKGKVVFLNFWATWCPPCKKEMPHIEELYQEYNLNKDDVVILGVANPSSDEYPRNSDVSQEEITAFLEDNGYTFPVVFDTTGEIFASYYINALPTTFMIDKDGNIYGYVASMLTKDIMKQIIDETLDLTTELE
jgi:cytochrome c-type biogenesis protein